MSDDKFQRDQVCYEQNFQQARSLNVQMNQVPVLAMTLTGGLWFAAGVTKDLYPEIRFGLLLFAGFCNIALILAAFRIRDVFHCYLEKIETFDSTNFATGKPSNPKAPILGDYSMISIYCSLLGIGSILSFLGAFGFYWPFPISLWIGVATLILILVHIQAAHYER